MRALLAPHVDGAHISAQPEPVTTPDLSLLVRGWGSLDPFSALRELQARFATPVIVVIGPRGGSLISKLLRAGAADCVRWPVAHADAELLARVDVQLISVPEAIELDAASLTLRCPAVRAQLTPTEFRIAEYLLLNRSHWSSNEEMTTATVRSARGSESLLRVHIHAIRRKLKHEAWRLLSNKRLGYRFDTSQAKPKVD